MAELSEAFNGIRYDNINTLHSIDYFFTQRNLKEEHEYLDKNLNRKNKKINIMHNFLAICIPNYELQNNNMNHIEIEIFGESGFNYKGKLINIIGSSPNFMIPLKSDKKLFVHLFYKQYNRDNDKEIIIKEFVCFIEVPKRFQSTDDINNTESELTI